MQDARKGSTGSKGLKKWQKLALFRAIWIAKLLKTFE
jgi:hypothetical protein